MPVTVQCPNPACGKTASVAENYLGHAVRCKHCGHKFTLHPSSADSPPARAPDPVVRAKETRRAPGTMDSSRPVAPSAGASKPAAIPSASHLPQQISRFRNPACLGHGELGTVYRAYDPQVWTARSPSRCPAGLLEAPGRSSASCARPGRGRQLHHPHIVPVFEAGKAANTTTSPRPSSPDRRWRPRLRASGRTSGGRRS